MKEKYKMLFLKHHSPVGGGEMPYTGDANEDTAMLWPG